MSNEQTSVNSPKCRRCTECAGEEHHWSDEYIVWADDEPGHPAAKRGLDCWLTCKHCEAWKPYPDDDEEIASDDEVATADERAALWQLGVSDEEGGDVERK
jgi:hypothetical protein